MNKALQKSKTQFRHSQATTERVAFALNLTAPLPSRCDPLSYAAQSRNV